MQRLKQSLFTDLQINFQFVSIRIALVLQDIWDFKIQVNYISAIVKPKSTLVIFSFYFKCHLQILWLMTSVKISAFVFVLSLKYYLTIRILCMQWYCGSEWGIYVNCLNLLLPHHFRSHPPGVFRFLNFDYYQRCSIPMATMA